MDVEIDNFIILDLDGEILAQRMFKGMGLGHADLVFRLAISRVAKNLENKTMSLNYREVDYYFHRKSDQILIFGLQHDAVDKSHFRHVLNSLLEPERFERLMGQSAMPVEELESRIDEFIPQFTRAMHQSLDEYFDLSTDLTGQSSTSISDIQQ